LDGIASHYRAVKTLEAFGTGTIIATELGSLKSEVAPYWDRADATVPLRTENAQRFDATQ
jgi:hypothetical protein